MMLTRMPVKPRSRTRFGRGGFIYCLLSALILIVGVHMQANLLFWTFGLMVGSMVVSLLLPLMMLHGISVRRIVPEHGIAGQMMPIRYELVNYRSWFASFGLVISEGWGRGAEGWRHSGPVAEYPPRLPTVPQTWVMHLGAGQTVEATAPCWPGRRGMLRFEKVVLSTSFPFGIFQRVLEFDQTDEVLIYPRLYRVRRTLLSQVRDPDLRGRQQMNQAGGHEEFYGLREYRPQDSIKVIDWRRSARTGKFVSKEMTRPRPPKIMLALDLSDRYDQTIALAILPRAGATGSALPENPPTAETFRNNGNGHRPNYTERAISLAASLVCEAHHHGFQIGLAVQGAPCTPFPMRYGLSHRTKILEALARLDVSNQITDATPLPAAPSVVVRTGRGDGSRNGAGIAVLGAAQMAQYVSDFNEDAGASATAPSKSADGGAAP